MTAIALLGTEHLVEWDGADGRPDILSADRQREVGEVVDRLARFSPTKIAVEMLASYQHELDSLVASWAEGGLAEHRSELVQIGLRLALESGASVHAVDANWTLDHAGIEEFFSRRPDARPAGGLSDDGVGLVERRHAQRSRVSLAEYLVALNEDPDFRLNDREYLDRWLPAGAGDNWGGVDLVASWYRRNLRIFANLEAIAAPTDRVVVVFGLAHINSLRHFVETSAAFRLVDVGSLLAA